MKIKKKILYLMGGLGNTLFQLNFASQLRSSGHDIIINTSILQHNFITRTALGWGTHNTLETLHQLNALTDFEVDAKLSLHLFFGLLSKNKGRKIFHTEYYGLDTPAVEKITAKHLIGYFHLNNKANLDFLNRIRRAVLFQLNSQFRMNLKSSLEAIGSIPLVHIRGGDYKSDPTFNLDSRYYRNALKDFTSCFIVTNDRKHASEIMRNIDINYTFVESSSTLDDFVLLAMCKVKILANSTFSWWASEVGSEASIVFQPDPFFHHIDWRPFTLIHRNLVCN